MKKKITFLLAGMLLAAGAFAQTLSTYTLDDFENGQVNFTDGVNLNPSDQMTATVVDNPVLSPANTSSKVWRWARTGAATSTQIWAGFWASLKTPVPTGYHRIELKYLRMNATSQIRIKCEGAVTKEINATTPASKTGQWETLSFDLYSNGIRNINVFGFFPDYFDQPVDGNAVVYIDDITVVYDPSIVPPPAPSSLTLFDNSTDNRFHDQSWTNVTAPSTLTRENWQGPGMPDGDKLPVVTSPVQAGTNALKLQWKSVSGGDWRALVASVGWNLFDLTSMSYLRFWVYSPDNLSTAALPKIYLEAASGTPNATGKVSLSAYLSSLTANTWTQVNVPLADLWAADAAFSSKDQVKGVFFVQNATDNTDHTLYLDEFSFSQLPTALTPVSADALRPVYTNGTLHLGTYTGLLSVYHPNGTLLHQGICTHGTLALQLDKGMYVLKTPTGSLKLLVY